LSDQQTICNDPDKRNGVVILNRCDYVSKMQTVLNDAINS